jgi:fermentation-respiration switch protein FrsA (DUF1100 family)
VVVEAAARDLGASFIVSNSGPGVSPVVQERFATQTRMRTAGMSGGFIAEMLATYDELIDLARSGAPIGLARERLETTVHDRDRPDTWIDLAGDEKSWQMMQQLTSYDPGPALTAIRVPLQVIYGASDPLVPVADSERALRTYVSSEYLSVRVLAGADHRLRAGDPPTFDRNYFDTLDAFLDRVLASNPRR